MIDRMTTDTVEDYVNSVKERESVTTSALGEVYDLLKSLEIYDFDYEFFSQFIREHIEDDDEKYMCFFNGLKEKLFEYMIMHFHMDIFSPMSSNIYDILIEMSCDPEEIDSFCGDVFNNIYRLDEKAYKETQKKVGKKIPKKARAANWTPKNLALKNKAVQRRFKKKNFR